jgi:putative membrane protein
MADVRTGRTLRLPGTPEGWALWGLFAYTFIALVGYTTFGLRPENLPGRDFAIRIYQVAFVFFSRAQIVVSALVLFIALFRHAGLRWLPAFAAVYFISFMSEHIGTGYGFPFSGYEYTGLLGPRVGERVPIVIPMSWFLMAAPSWILAREVFPEQGARGWIGRILLGSGLLVAWDLALDPAMSNMTTYWLWEGQGAFCEMPWLGAGACDVALLQNLDWLMDRAYYGMPWINLVGWLVTGLFIFAALEVLQAGTDWAGSLSARWSAWYYAGVLLMPLGMVTAGGFWGATAATLLTLAAFYGLYRWRRSRSGPGDGVGRGRPASALAASGGPR